MGNNGKDRLLAEKIAADRRWFEATPEQFDAFNQQIDAPYDDAKLNELATMPSPFDKP